MIGHEPEGRELATGTREVGGYEVPSAMRGESTMEKKSARGVGIHSLRVLERTFWANANR